VPCRAKMLEHFLQAMLLRKPFHLCYRHNILVVLFFFCIYYSCTYTRVGEHVDLQFSKQFSDVLDFVFCFFSCFFFSLFLFIVCIYFLHNRFFYRLFFLRVHSIVKVEDYVNTLSTSVFQTCFGNLRVKRH